MKPPTKPPTRPSLPPPPANQNGLTRVQFAKVAEAIGHRVVLFGPGGIGKSTLACLIEGETVVIDADESLPVLKANLKELGVKIPQTMPCKNWPELLGGLKAPGWDGVKNIVLDTGTKAEEWATAHTLATVPGDKGRKVSRVEDYGFGKGYQHIYDTFLPLLAAFDTHAKAGRNIFIITHDCTANVPNPGGEDWIRYEPRLQNPKSGNGSIRLKLREWADHVLFLGYDVVVDEDGKGKGHGSRTLYTAEKPFCMAKSRTASQLESITIKVGESPWSQILV